MRPLQNRIDPAGALIATPERGSLMGNRGGRFHDCASQSVSGRPYASRQWICCRLAFNNRQRQVWGRGYTELFFHDEVTALAAGHRPCFECRREDAVAFAQAWGRATAQTPPQAAQMDRVLQVERLLPRPGYGKRVHPMTLSDLPDGVMILHVGKAHALDGGRLRAWSFSGYGPAEALPAQRMVDVLTPPSIVMCLKQGYRPGWAHRPE